MYSPEQVIELLEGLQPVVAPYPADLLAARRAAFIEQVEARRVNGTHKQPVHSPDRIFEVLEALKTVVAPYPPELLAARRAAFIDQIEARRVNGTHKQPARASEQIFQLLESLKTVAAPYPEDLLAARRASFIAQIEQYNAAAAAAGESPTREQVIEVLEQLRPVTAEYPPELLAARRAAFIAQVDERNRVVTPVEALPSSNGRLFRFFDRLKSIQLEYPRKLWTARRAAFVAQIRDGRTSVLEALRLAVQNLFHGTGKTPFAPILNLRRLSLVVTGLLVVIFMSSLLYENRQPLSGVFESVLPEQEVSTSGPLAAATSTEEVAQVICKPGYLPPLCLAQASDKSQNLTDPDNGSARPAVAKDTLPGYSKIYQAAYVNDGLYGPGASWISNSAYSWIKIDLGKARTINTVTFGRDRLGNLNDGDPGQFVIAVALEDDVYADGNSSNDSQEYTEVYNSREVGFDGLVSGPETVTAGFDPVMARYVKLTFENAGTAVDEIEVFMLQPRDYGTLTQRPKDDVAPSTSTPIPTLTLPPTKIPTLVPTNTPVPTSTPVPSDTNTPVPTDTPFPTDTSTPNPSRTPRPTRTPTEEPTNTPRPPTDTPEPPPTDTPEPPPTDTPQPPPTDTSEPPTPWPNWPTDTPQAAYFPTETPRPKPTPT